MSTRDIRAFFGKRKAAEQDGKVLITKKATRNDLREPQIQNFPRGAGVYDSSLFVRTYVPSTCIYLSVGERVYVWLRHALMLACAMVTD